MSDINDLEYNYLDEQGLTKLVGNLNNKFKPTIRATYEESPALYSHAVDDIIYFEEHLYTVTEDIDVDDTITDGDNIEPYDVDEGAHVYIDKLPGGGGGSSSGSVITATYEEATALNPHAVGTYVYFDSHVYKVTSAIAIGDAVAVGTNVALDPSLSGDDLITIEGVPGNSIIAASDISYNNTSSGLSATKAQGAIDEINSKITSNTLGSIVDISEYTSSSPYTFPSDGYVWVGFDATEGEYEVSGRVLSSSGTRSLPIYAKSTTGGGHYASEYGASVFVKKGMKGFTLFNTSPSHGGLYFYPLS